MRAIVRRVRHALAARRLRRRFPAAVIHDDVLFDDETWLGAHAVLFPGVRLHEARIGAFTYLQAGTGAFNAEIGPFCSIAAGVAIGLAAHPTTMVSTSPVFYDPDQPLPRILSARRTFTASLPRTTIGADVWIGQGALLKAGITVGVGAVIGAGSVVTKDVGPYQIVGGNPARVIRPRFDQALAERLARSRWWELEEDRLVALVDRFDDPLALLAALEADEQ